jgi:DNA-binding response OmpR family regulator
MKGETPMANEQVLILEDDLAALNLVSKQLTAAGFRVIPVGDGRLAIETCRSQRPDLVVCDLSMPGMDGFEFIRQLRREQFNAPIVVVSGLSREKGEEALAAGANAFLLKPVDGKLLALTVEKEIAAAHVRARAKRKHIMVVEDDPMALRLLRSTLEPAGYRVSSVENGTAAMEMAENDPPDMVVSDIVLPGIDGVQLITWLRGDFGFKAPILVVSGHSEEKYRTAALGAGADLFLVKPVDRTELLARVKELLSVR